MKLYTDNLIQSFQKYGGISTVINNLNDEFKVILENYVQLDIKAKSKVKKIRFKLLPFIYIKDNQNHCFISSFNLISLNRKSCNVIIIHDLMDEIFKPTLFSYLHIWNKFIAILFADKIICVSKNTKNDLLKFYPFLKKNNKVIVIYNPVKKNSIFNQPIKKKKYVIYQGNRGKFKGFIQITKLLESLPKDIKILIIGEKLDNKESQLLLPFIDRIQVKKSPKDDEFGVLLSQALFLFYPSTYEGFGLPPLESISYGTKVLCGNGGSLPEVCIDKNIYIFDANDSTSLKMNLKRLLCSNFDFDSRDRTLDKYCPNKIANQYINLITS
jgi:glycosyltransferase involved in cell wall biosynthesis